MARFWFIYQSGIELNNGDRFSASEDGPVEAALAEYFDRLDRGEEVDLPALVLAHPGCEDGLRRFLKHEDKLHEAVSAVSPAPPKNLAGRTLGDFQLLRIIGRGGMGVVYEAEQLSLGRKVAVKLLPSGLCADPRHRTRFQNEARILAQLAHAHIVNVIAVGEEAETYYFAMQYIEGMTADDLIRRWTSEKPPHDAETARGQMTDDTEAESVFDSANGRVLTQFPRRVASSAERSERYRLCARIAAEVAEGLAHAHACGVLHRDVKPSNILLDQSGTARLTDFGLARMYGEATLTATGAILGTLRYASPEQLGRSHAAADERSDIYSLGVTLWELVTGRRLFKAENHNSVISQVLNTEAPRPSSFAVKLPRDLETVIAHAMSKEPRDRYPSAQTMADDLRRFLGGRPIQAKPVTLGERAFRWASGNRTLATTAIGSLVVLLVVAMLASGLVFRANSRTAAALIESRENESKAKESAVAAEASERKTRELLYATDMALAGAAWRKQEVAQVREILNRYAEPKRTAAGSSFEDLRGFEWYFLDRLTRPQSELLFQNEQALYVIGFTSEGKEFFTAGKDSVVRWHDVKSGKVVRSLSTQQEEVNCISYNPAGTRLATAGDDGTVKIWNTADQSLIRSIKACDGKCFFAKFLDGELIIVGGDGAAHWLINSSTGELLRKYVVPTPGLPTGCFGSTGVACVSKTGKRFWTVEQWSDSLTFQGLYEWDVETGKPRRLTRDRNIRNVFADSSEKFLFISTAEGLICILDAESGDEIQSVRLGTSVRALAMTPDAHQLVVGDDNGQIHVWKLDLSNPSQAVSWETSNKFSVQEGPVSEIGFSPLDDSLVTIGHDGSVRRTRLETPGSAIQELKWLQRRNCVPIPGSKTVAATRPLGIYDLNTGKLLKSLSTDHYSGLGVSADGTLIAAGSGSHIGVWKVATGEQVLRLDEKRKWTGSIDFASDNSLLAVHSRDFDSNRMDIVKLPSGEIERLKEPLGSSMWAYFCDHDGLVTYRPSGQVICLNARDQSLRWESEFSARGGSAVAISPDRKLLLVQENRVLTLIDCATGSIRCRTSCDYLVKQAAFTLNQRSFVIGGVQGELSLWHADTGRRLFDIGDLGAVVTDIFGLDDGFLAMVRHPTDGGADYVQRWYQF